MAMKTAVRRSDMSGKISGPGGAPTPPVLARPTRRSDVAHDTPLTFPQRRVLGALLMSSVGRLTPRQLHVRSDVLWRLSERGLVACNGFDEWHITPAGQAAYEAFWGED